MYEVRHPYKVLPQYSVHTEYRAPLVLVKLPGPTNHEGGLSSHE
jgi:hypothetical protein